MTKAERENIKPGTCLRCGQYADRRNEWGHCTACYEVLHAAWKAARRHINEGQAARWAELGFHLGARVEYDAIGWMLGARDTVTGIIRQRAGKWYVKLDRPFNGEKSAALTSAWRLIKEAQVEEV